MRVVSSARWIAISQASRIGTQLIGLVVLARLLPPSEFGLMAMATVVVNFAHLLRDMGTASAVVQKDVLTEDTTSTVFWLNIGLGVLLGIALAGISPLIAEGFRAPQLIPVLSILALVFPVTSSAAVHQALLERQSKFRLIAGIEIVSSLLALAVALALAYCNFGVLSLASQVLAAAIFSSAQLWMYKPWIPKMIWRNSELRSIWRFSGHMAGFSFINFLARNADAVIVGRLLGSIPLGIYSQAYKVMMFPLQSMTSVASRALFPVMSRQQNDPNQMAALYFRSFRLIATMSAPLMGGLWVLRAPFVNIVLGNRWSEVANILAWLAPVGFIQSLLSTTGTVFMAAGRTDLLMRLGVIGAILQVSAFFVGVQWGIEGVAVCYLAANALNVIPCVMLTLRQLRGNIADVIEAILKPVILTSIMMAILYAALSVVSTQVAEQLIPFAGLVALGAAVYLILLVFFAKPNAADLIRILTKVNSSSRNIDILKP